MPELLTTDGALPPDDPLRAVLHIEVHARPPARIHLPALITYVAVLNDGVSRDAEQAHLQRLPRQQGLKADDLAGNFLRLRLRLPRHSVKWERNGEFTRYSIVQPLPAPVALTGRFVRKAGAVDLGGVLREIDDARAEGAHAACACRRPADGRPAVAQLAIDSLPC